MLNKIRPEAKMRLILTLGQIGVYNSNSILLFWLVIDF